MQSVVGPGEPARILLWADHFRPSIGGAEMWRARYVAALHERDRSVKVLVADEVTLPPDVDAAGHEEEGIVIHRLDAGLAVRSGDARRTFAVLHRAAQIESAFSPDLIHLSTGMAPASLLLFLLSRSRAAGSPATRPALLVTLHAQWPEQVPLAGAPIDRLLKAADGITVFSRSMFHWTLQRWPALTDRLSIVPHVIPLPHASRVAPDEQQRPPNTLAFIGRLSLEKGADLALRAFRLLRSEFPQLHLTVAGDGKERRSLVALARELGIADAVTFAGFLAPGQVRALLRSSAVLMVPSRQESFGQCVVEAAQEACPVVATNVGGLPEACIDGETGLLCPPESPKALAAAVARLLANPALARRLGHNGRVRALSTLTWDEHVDTFEHLYRGLIRQPVAADATVMA